MGKKKLKMGAILVSRVLDPIVVFGFLFFYILFFEIGIKENDFGKTFVFIMGELLVCTAFLFYLIKKGVVDYDISKREKRIKFLGPVLGFLIGMIPFLLFLKIRRLFWLLQLMAVFFVFVWIVINRFYKISGHVGVLTVVVLIFTRMFGFGNYLFLLVPVLGWSRVYLKKHSKGEVILGAGVAFLLGEVMLEIGGY